MKIDVLTVMKNESDQVDFDFDVDLSELSDAYGNSLLADPIRINGCVVGILGSAKLSMSTSGTFHLTCDRCLSKFKSDFFYSLEAMVTTDQYTSDPDSIVCDEDGLIDIIEQAQSLIVVEMPIKNLCSENCKGLCPVCGTNLNEDMCSCKSS